MPRGAGGLPDSFKPSGAPTPLRFSALIPEVRMLARIISGAVIGVDAILIDVEVDIASGLPCINVVGLPEGAVREGRERVTAALHNTGHVIPPRRITVNLAPASCSIAWRRGVCRGRVRGFAC